MTKTNFIKPPHFITNLFDKFRKWKLVRYKKKKVRQEKTRRDRSYLVKFTVKIQDQINPQESEREYEMMVPAKAAFFAKRKARKAMMEKFDFYFTDCDLVTDDELEYYEKSRERYVKQKEKESKKA